MRTLKKSLALVLALVMVLGLGVVGASADNALDDYKDLDKLDAQYVEAAGVMTGLGIINGIDAVTLDPDGTYTREQAAKIIAYMVLGADNAEAMTCTVAPFDDVPASHWSAKYINFCVNEGIIDGMSEDTFAPFDTLTGFQWAKMLLSAVGFNAKKELTGADWAIKTQSIASQTGLFNGDLKGGDHVALRREQAILYAFNTLTSIKCVTWSESLGDYFYTYDVGNRFTYEGTLGWHVYDLKFVEGVVTNNEGMGATATTVESVKGSAVIATTNVAAGTGLDMMWHAARVWYIDDAKNTGVYTHDLATNTVYKCGEMGGTAETAAQTALKKAGKTITGKTIGSGDAYVSSLIDNSAYTGAGNMYDVLDVTFYVLTATMGRTDTTSGKTNFKNLKNVAGNNFGESIYSNTAIKSDISKLTLGTPVIIMVIDNGKAVYASAISSTVGAVKSLNLDNGTITLTDGTVLAKSALFNDTAALTEIENYLATPGVTTPAYTFTLDTHGHYMAISSKTPADVAYFTGATKVVAGAWNGEETYYAQFVNLTTGKEFDVEVTEAWYNKAVAGTAGEYYFDLHTGEFGETAVTPTEVNRGMNKYDGTYVIMKNNSPVWTIFTVGASTTRLPAAQNVANGIAIDVDTVNFVVGMGTGSNVKFTSYAGFEAMASALSKQYGVPVTSVSLTNAIVVLDSTGTYATTVFATGVANAAVGGYVYFTTANTGWTAADDGYFKAPAYVNGVKTEVTFKTNNKNAVASAGLYSYSIDLAGYCTFTKETVLTVTQNNGVLEPANANGLYSVVDSANSKSYTADSNTIVVDVTNPAVNDAVKSLNDMYLRIQNGETFEVSFYVASGSYISVMYVTQS